MSIFFTISLQAQASASVQLSLEPSKYMERSRNVFIIKIFICVFSLLMIIPIPLQAQTSANAILPLEPSKYLGRYQILFTCWITAFDFILYFSLMVIFPISLQAQASANVKLSLEPSKYLERYSNISSALNLSLFSSGICR